MEMRPNPESSQQMYLDDFNRMKHPDAIAHSIEQITRMFQETDVACLALMGPSGAGKTTLAKKLTAELADLDALKDVQPVFVEADDNLGTLRGSIRRQAILETLADFRKGFYDLSALLGYIGGIRTLGKSGGILTRKNVYQGRQFADTVDHFVPYGRKLVVVSGTDLIPELSDVFGDQLMAMLPYRKPDDYMRAAILRDIQTGKANSKEELEGRLQLRDREYSLQHHSFYDQRVLWKKMAEQGRFVMVDNSDIQPHLAADLREEIARIMGHDNMMESIGLSSPVPMVPVAA